MTNQPDFVPTICRHRPYQNNYTALENDLQRELDLPWRR